MDVIVPIQYSLAQVSSTVPENEYPVYSSATTYAVDEYVVFSHAVYQSIQPSNVGHSPDTSTDWWLWVSPTNMAAMFHHSPSYATSSTGSMTVEVSVAGVTDIALLGVIAGTVQIYSGSILRGTYAVPAPVSPSKSSQLLITSLASISSPLKLVISGTGTVSVTNLVAGNLNYIGATKPKFRLSLTDYSVKKEDDYGVTSVTKRNYSRRMSAKVTISQTDVDRVVPLVASLRSTFCVWVGLASVKTSVVYGYYTDWGVNVPSPESTEFGITVESLASDDAYIQPGGATAVDGAGLLTAYTIHIESTNGDEFRVGLGQTTLLIAHVFNGLEEVTASIPDSWFRWRRVSRIAQPPPNDDATWNNLYRTGYKNVMVSVDDVYAQATFHCDIFKPE